MSKVAVVTDSVADIPPLLAIELGITVIPAIVRFGLDVYRDGLDISPDQFYEKLKTSNILPKTSMPSPGKFSETYDRLAEKTDQIAVIIVSSKLTSGYQIARQSVELMKRQCQVKVLDSQWAVMAQGLISIAAARAAQSGARLDDVIDVARQTIERVGFCGTFDTLKYLQQGGRIGRAQAFIGSLLNFNPVLCMKNGEMHPFNRARSRIKALDVLINYVKTGFDNVEELAVGYATDQAEADNLVRRLNVEYPNVPLYISRAGSVIGAHSGPGFVYVSVLGDKK